MELDLTGVLEVNSEPDDESETKTGLTLPHTNHPGPLYFDLETVPDESRQHLFGFDEIPDVPPETPIDEIVSPEDFLSAAIKDMPDLIKGKRPPSEWIEQSRNLERDAKKPRKGVFDLLDGLESMGTAVESAKAEQCKKMSVTPEMCRIVSIGMAVREDEVQTILCRDADEEHDAICHWWDVAARVKGPVCGYNIIGFDIPVILTRSAILGITPTRDFRNIKPWDRTTALDLMACRFSRSGASKLKDLAKWLGIEVDAEGVDGSQVLELFQSDPDLLRKYVASDVEVTRRLHRYWDGYFC